MSPTTPVRDLRLGRLRLVTLTDQIAESIGDELDVDEGGVAIAKRRPRKFSFVIPIHGATDPNPYQLAQRLRRQVRAAMENATYRDGALYMAFTPDPELNGWMSVGSGQIQYKDGGVTFGEYQLELDTAFRIGSLRTHRPARRVELYDRTLPTTFRDARSIITGTDFAALRGTRTGPYLATGQPTYLPVGAMDPLATAAFNYSRALVTTQARAGIDGAGSFVTGLQHGNVVSYEQAENQQNLGDVVVWDRQGVTNPTVPLALTNLVPNPSFETDLAGWGNSDVFLSSGVLTRVTSQAFAGNAALQVVTAAGTQDTSGAQAEVPGTFKAGTTYTFSVYAKGAVGGESLGFVFGSNNGRDLGYLGTQTVSADWVRYSVTWTPNADRSDVVCVVRNDAATAATYYVDAVMVTQGPAAVAYSDGDTPGWVWNGTPGSSTSTLASSYTASDPQANYGWEEVYGPDQPLTANDCVVVANGVCRIRFVASTTSLAVDTYVPGTGYVEQGRITIWDSVAQDAYTQQTQPVAANSGAYGTVIEWTPERAVIRLSTYRSSTDSTFRIDTYITLQRGWSGPRVEAYATSSTTTTPGVQLRWTPNLAIAMTLAGPSGSLLVNWANVATGPTFQSVREPWVLQSPASPSAGTRGYAVVSIQSLARYPTYTDNAAYGQGRQSVGVAARYGEAQTTTGVYGYVSLHLGFPIAEADGTFALSNAAGTGPQDRAGHALWSAHGVPTMVARA